MKVRLNIDGKNSPALRLPKGALVLDLFRKADLRPDGHIAVREDTVIPLDESLHDGDIIKILRVASGG